MREGSGRFPGIHIYSPARFHHLIHKPSLLKPSRADMDQDFTFDFERQLEPQPSYHVSAGQLDRCSGGGLEQDTVLWTLSAPLPAYASGFECTCI